MSSDATMAAWLDEAARYFAGRPTKGEDSAHWANVHNAGNAQKIAARFRELSGLSEAGSRDPSSSREASKSGAADGGRPNIEPSRQWLIP